MGTSLREIAERLKPLIPELEWVTYDGRTVKCYKASSKPLFNGCMWTGDAVASLKIPRAEISTKGMEVVKNDPVTGLQSRNYGNFIFGFEDNMRKLVEDKAERDKHTTRKKGVIAYFTDGSTVLFDTFTECKEFFGLASLGEVRRAIDLGTPLPDGSTMLDEAPDEAFVRQIFRS